VVEPSSSRSGVYVGMTRGRGANLGLVLDPTGLADAEEAFAAVIARPPNARTALAVRERLRGHEGSRVEGAGP
jgi:ATP-dependent exoDNAse (exonuclease V) alpha subunit